MFLKWEATWGNTGEEIVWLMLWTPGTELFNLVELCLKDGHEMAGHLGVTLGEGLYMIIFSHYGLEIFVFVYNLIM